ncbi:MAG: DUF2721 domain-containing protein [Candidatus Hodarchaeales archaeon]|jgi:uncharacterized membrane protein YdbT with pleckstrin-like domain
MVDSATEIISSTVAPIVLISAIGLLLLMEQNRYARIKDRAFDYISRRNELRTMIQAKTQQAGKINEESQEQTEKLRRQLGHCERILAWEMREALLIKNAMFAGLIAIIMVSLTSLLLLATSNTSSDWLISLNLSVFALGLFSLLISVIFMAIDVWVSYSTLSEERISYVKL